MATVGDRHAGGRPKRLPRTPIGQRIERLADARGLHLDEVADAAGIKFPTLNRILTGRIASPRLETVQAIAKALGVKLEKLVP